MGCVLEDPRLVEALERKRGGRIEGTVRVASVFRDGWGAGGEIGTEEFEVDGIELDSIELTSDGLSELIPGVREAAKSLE